MTDFGAAYRAQRELIPDPAGFKVALTNPAAQAAFGVEHPLYGGITADRILESPAELPLDGQTERFLELEVAILRDDAGRLTARAAFEVVEPKRARRHRLATDVESFVADGSAFAWAVLGDPIEVPLEDLAGLRATLEVDGGVGATDSVSGGLDNVLGGPLVAYEWFLGEIARYEGESAPALVLTGSAIPMQRIEPGRTYRGTIQGASVSLEVS